MEITIEVSGEIRRVQLREHHQDPDTGTTVYALPRDFLIPGVSINLTAPVCIVDEPDRATFADMVVRAVETARRKGRL